MRWNWTEKKSIVVSDNKNKKKKKMINYSRHQIVDLIDEYIVGKNAIRNRDILKDRLIDGLTHEKLAEKYDMSVRQIKNIIYKNEEIVFKHL